MEIGKAYGKSFYFPADMHIKTVIGTIQKFPHWEVEEMEFLAHKVAKQIVWMVEQLS